MAPNPKHPPRPPMTLGNMREMGDHDGYVVEVALGEERASPAGDQMS